MKSRDHTQVPCIAVEGTVEYPSDGITESFFRKAAGLVCHELSLPPDRVTIILCDDAFISELNTTYRGKTGPTDVISFAYGEGDPFPSGEPGEDAGGDIFISLDTARRQAREFNISYRHEMLRLLVHGMLHLAGYDHERGEADERLMTEKEEAFIMKVLAYTGQG